MFAEEISRFWGVDWKYFLYVGDGVTSWFGGVPTVKNTITSASKVK